MMHAERYAAGATFDAFVATAQKYVELWAIGQKRAAVPAGVSGLAAILVLRKRLGYPQHAMHPNSMVLTLLGAGLFYLVIWDQRRRCRTCLRRLMMPINSGSWGNMLRLGRPMTEYICPFGHGTLQIDELQITGKNTPNWQAHDENIWKELESYHHPAGK